MAARKAISRFSCAQCGEAISDRMLWVDNGGFLCRDCATLTRYRRMRGEGAKIARRTLRSEHRGG